MFTPSHIEVRTTECGLLELSIEVRFAIVDLQDLTVTQGIVPILSNDRLPRRLVGVLVHAAIALLVMLPRLAIAEPSGSETAAAPNADARNVSEAGLPFIRNFDPDEYGAFPQNWAITQDRQGVIYVGNNTNGVLAFDGSNWRPIAIGNGSIVRALATDDAGRVYVGGVGELGYLAPDGSGEMHYVSLLNRLPSEDREFTNVWRIFPTGEGIYFCTPSHIFRLRETRVTVWKPATSFHLAFRARDTLFVREVDRGLLQLVGDRMMPVPGGERFATEKIYSLLPWGATSAAKTGDVLIGTRTQGWFVFDGTNYRPWITEADAALNADGLYDAVWLADGTLAVATLQGGVRIFDDRGRLLRHLTKASGLAGDVVYALFQDRQQGLWLALDAGVVRVDIGSPITHYDDRAGLHGAVLALQRHAGRLYAGTLKGVFRLETDQEGGARFTHIKQIPGSGWAFLEWNKSLLVATDSGVFEIGDDRVRQVRASERVSVSLLRSKQDPSRVFVGMQDGLASMRLENDVWIDEGRISAITGELSTLFEEPDGRLWLGNRNGGVVRLTFPPDWADESVADSSVHVERFGIEQGLPQGAIAVYALSGVPRFVGASGGLLEFDEIRRRFDPDPRFAVLFPGGLRYVMSIYADARRRYWMITSGGLRGLEEIGAAVKDVNGLYRWVPTPWQPNSNSSTQVIQGDGDGVMWFGGAKGLIRYDTGAGVPNDPLFTALVRRVTARDGRVVFGGTGTPAIPQFEHGNNALRVEFAAPSYVNLESNRFEVLLEGLDSTWSKWSKETYRDYTSLPERDYRFRVRARNAYGVVGAEATYAFGILPPWYRTSWAYLGFAVLIVVTLWLLFQGLFWTRLQIVTARAGVMEERNRIAQEIHDSLGQGLAGIAMQLQAVKRARAVAPELMDPLLDRADAQFKDAVEETRRAILALRPLALERHGLVAALRELVASYPDLPDAMQFHLSGEPRTLPDVLELHLFRLAQEAITNVVQHADASAVCIGLDFGNKVLRLQVTDNGQGMDTGPLPSDRGMGLSGMRKRVAKLGGRMEITSTRGSGTTLAVTVPCPSKFRPWRFWNPRRPYLT